MEVIFTFIIALKSYGIKLPEKYLGNVIIYRPF